MTRHAIVIIGEGKTNFKSSEGNAVASLLKCGRRMSADFWEATPVEILS